MNKNRSLPFEPDSHATLRATTIDKQIDRLEDIVSHKGVTIKPNQNEILDAIQLENGVVTSDEDVFSLAKLYCVRGQIKQLKDRCPVVDISIAPYFSFDEAAHAMAAQLLGRSLQFSEKPELILFESIANKRRERGGKKPLLYIIIRWDGSPRNERTDLVPFLDVVKSLIVTREARVITFSAKPESLPEEFTKLFKLIRTGGYFS